MRWQWKCLIDNCKGILPFQDQLRAAKYRFIYYTSDPEVDAWTIKQGLAQVEWVRSVRSLDASSVLEIGSGWQPMIPILFSLAGASHIFLTDLNRLCRSVTFDAALQSIRSQKPLILNSLQITAKAFDEALDWHPSSGLEEGFRRLRLKYLAPCDCQRLDLPDGPIDVVTSRAVLEHIPPQVIEGIFAESFRLLKSNGLACHFIDNSDHWEHKDKSISRVNFLKFPDFIFRWTHLQSLNYQNRLRHPEYVEKLQKSGFAIRREERKVDPGAISALATLPIADRFCHFAPEDLATISSYLLAGKTGPQTAATR